jgi:hypothetical protein
MKKVVFISLCITNLLNAGPDEQALELWKSNVLNSIKATEKLQKPLINYYPKLKSNQKSQILGELKDTAKKNHDYFKNLTTSEFRKNIGKQALKNGTIASLGTVVFLGSTTYSVFWGGMLPFWILGNIINPNIQRPDDVLFFLSMIASTSLATVSTFAALKYGKLTFNNIRGLVNTEQQLFEKQIMSNYNFQKLEKLQKTISNNDL